MTNTDFPSTIAYLRSEAPRQSRLSKLRLQGREQTSLLKKAAIGGSLLLALALCADFLLR